MERLDPKVIERIGGPAWVNLRPTVVAICETLLSVSPSARGTLITVYVKFDAEEETAKRPFAVLWLRKASELVVGLSLPEESDIPELVGPPPGCSYAGLTAFLCLTQGMDLPPHFDDWVRDAFKHAQTWSGGTRKRTARRVRRVGEAVAQWEHTAERLKEGFGID